MRTVPPKLHALCALGLALVVAATVAFGDPATVMASQRAGNGLTGWLSTATKMASPFVGVLGLLGQPDSLDTGSDGRLTILLLGADTRTGGAGRTDTIMVMSVKNGIISAASIPRDTARIPNPAGGTFKGKVNGIVRQFVRGGSSLTQALAKFTGVVESVLQIEIDYYVMITFKGFEKLVDVVDPIYVDNARTIKDSKFWDDPTKPAGAYFPASSAYLLNSLPDGPLCNGLWKTAANPDAYACHRALPFVRSRKGKGNSDFTRARRQQDFVGAVIGTVGSSDLVPLLDTATNEAGLNHVVTDIPITYSNAYDLYSRLGSATLAHQVVFAPTTYSTRIPGTSSYQLTLTAVRAWTTAYMP